MAIDGARVNQFIIRYEERAAPAEKRASEALWRLATTGTEDAQRELARAGMEYNEIFSDGEDFKQLEEWYESRDAIENSLLRRQVEVLYRVFTGCQGDREILQRVEELEAEATAIYSNHRGTVGGRELRENEIREILRSSDDEPLRREAWEASKTVGREVEGTVRELARLRNRLAREQGYENHYLRSLDLQEIEAGELEEIMSGLESATEEPFRALKAQLDAELKERFGVEKVMPWHLSDPFFQTPPELPDLDVDRYFADKDLEALTRATYDALGLDVRGVMARSDLYERPGKDQHAFCLKIGRAYPYDVRVLANVRPDAYWMSGMLHEFGHAVYDWHINPKLPYFLRSYTHLAATEGVAIMMDSLVEDPGWLSSVAKVPEKQLDTDLDLIAARSRADKLVFVRWALVMYCFERELYADPDRGDLNSLWWDLVEELQLVNPPPARDEPDWAAKIHVAVHPVYYHNYVLGGLIAAQLRHYLETSITRGPFYTNEAAGRYMLEALFGPGARENWRDTVLRATGEPLNPHHFVKSLL